MRISHIRYMLFLLLPVLLLAGCQNPLDDHGPDAGSPTTFTATMELDAGTKTTLGALSGNTRPVKWQSTDSIALSGASRDYRVGTLSDNDQTATFTGSGAQVDGTVYKAYYPSSIYDKGTKAVTLPAEQTYSATNIANLPMYAESNTTSLNFKNLCAVLNFQLKGTDKVTKVVVTSATMKLNGSFTPAAEGVGYKAQMSSSTPTNAEKKVTLNCTGGVPDGHVQLNATTPIEFCIAIPPADYPQNNLTVEVYGYKGSNTTEELLMPAFKNSASASQFKRSEIYNIQKTANSNVTNPTMTTQGQEFSNLTPSTGFDNSWD